MPLNLPPLRDVIAAHGLAAKKSLGQNFLLDSNLLAKIARVPGDLDGAAVYEVGPGPGGLTRALLEAGADVTAVERDARCLPALSEIAAAAEGRLTVIEGDAMQVDEPHLFPGRAHIVANLPYNVGTALLVNWLQADWPPWWASLTLMFQREVANRIVAESGNAAYGRLSVLAQWRSRATIAMKVPARAFVPAPKVESAVIHITPIDAPAGVAVGTLSRLTEAAFGQRRKMLRTSLKGLPGAIEAMEKVGIDGTRRAETISVAGFVDLARELQKSNN
ncbi:16S rRNA (adenine(1518)-N(6)/adenine(1519)-N(6))-dimethyltransferase RsmA [Pacificimonas sp. ICDLI1SI03]